MSSPFQDRSLSIANNSRIRASQCETYELAGFAANPSDEREVRIVLLMGCGKSGCINDPAFYEPWKKLRAEFEPLKTTLIAKIRSLFGAADDEK